MAILTLSAPAGAADSDAVRAIVGEDASFRPGGERLPTGDTRWDSWSIECSCDGTDWPGLLDQAVAPLRQHGSHLTALRASVQVEAHLLLVAYMSEQTPVGSFTADQVRDLARFGCSLEIDLYVEPVEPEQMEAIP